MTEGEVESAAFQCVIDWLQLAEVVPIDGKYVPGASESERRSLKALGGLVRALTPNRVLRGWPPDLSDWLDGSPLVPRKVIAAAKVAFAHDPDAALATLYAQLVSVESRRPLGTFFTPAQEVQFMLDMWDGQNAPASVIDVGAGVGVFTALASKKWPDSEVYAVDINPVTLGLLGLRMALDSSNAQSAAPEPRIRLVRDDFASWLTHHGEAAQAPRLILGNPPYTRAQLLPMEERLRLGKMSDGLCGARASLSTLITAISLRHLGPNDGLCLLLPAQWLESEYAQPLRDYLARLTFRSVELRLVDSWRFPDALVDAVALSVGPEQEGPQPFRVANWRSEKTRTIRRGSLVGDRWRSLFVAAPTSVATEPNFSLLRDFCSVRRGVATGANEFFILNETKIIENRIPSRRLLRLARRLNTFGDRLDSEAFEEQSPNDKRWLLDVSLKHRNAGSAIDTYLAKGEEAGFDSRLLCVKRLGEWYELGREVVVPDVIFGPMTRGAARIVENEAGCVIANNLYGWRWHADTSGASRRNVLRWLRSDAGQQAIFESARRQGDGLIKIEPRALSNLRIPGTVATPPQMLS